MSVLSFHTHNHFKAVDYSHLNISISNFPSSINIYYLLSPSVPWLIMAENHKWHIFRVTRLKCDHETDVSGNRCSCAYCTSAPCKLTSQGEHARSVNFECAIQGRWLFICSICSEFRFRRGIFVDVFFRSSEILFF